jgi:hypothetical protein
VGVGVGLASARQFASGAYISAITAVSVCDLRIINCTRNLSTLIGAWLPVAAHWPFVYRRAAEAERDVGWPTVVLQTIGIKLWIEWHARSHLIRGCGKPVLPVPIPIRLNPRIEVSRDIVVEFVAREDTALKDIAELPPGAASRTTQARLVVTRQLLTASAPTL